MLCNTYVFYAYVQQVALDNACSNLVFLCDVDFVPSASLSALINTSYTQINTLLGGDLEMKALVVPAFETQEGTCASSVTDVKELCQVCVDM